MSRHGSGTPEEEHHLQFLSNVEEYLQHLQQRIKMSQLREIIQKPPQIHSMYPTFSRALRADPLRRFEFYGYGDQLAVQLPLPAPSTLAGDHGEEEGSDWVSTSIGRNDFDSPNLSLGASSTTGGLNTLENDTTALPDKSSMELVSSGRVDFQTYKTHLYKLAENMDGMLHRITEISDTFERFERLHLRCNVQKDCEKKKKPPRNLEFASKNKMSSDDLFSMIDRLVKDEPATTELSEISQWMSKIRTMLAYEKEAPRVLPPQKAAPTSDRRKLDCVLCPDGGGMTFEQSRIVKIQCVNGKPEIQNARSVLFQHWNGPGPRILKAFKRENEALQELSLPALGLTVLSLPDPRPEGELRSRPDLGDWVAKADNDIASLLVFANSNCNPLKIRNILGPVIVFCSKGRNLTVHNLKTTVWRFYGWDLDRSLTSQIKERFADKKTTAPFGHFTLPDEFWKEIKKRLKADEELSPDLMLHMRLHGFCCTRCKRVGQVVHKCSGCSLVRYCSSECQRSAWPTHKAECRREEVWVSEKRDEGQKGDAATQSITLTAEPSPKGRKAECSEVRQLLERMQGQCAKMVELSSGERLLHVAQLEPERREGEGTPGRGGRRRAGGAGGGGAGNVCCNCREAARQTCSRCRDASYCSKWCQREHWKSHRAFCAADGAASREVTVESLASGRGGVVELEVGGKLD